MLELDLEIHEDYLEEKILKMSDIGDGVFEIIANSLDADATEIRIEYDSSNFPLITEITFGDNGCGITSNTLEGILSKLGYSEKKPDKKTKIKQRFYLGNQGEGRFKILSIGNDLAYESVSKNQDGIYNEIHFNLSANNIKKIAYEQEAINLIAKTYTKCKINNLKPEFIQLLEENTNALQEIIKSKFAVYHESYSDFQIFINDKEIKFDDLIKNTYNYPLVSQLNEKEIKWDLKIVEWDSDHFNNSRDYKIYFCGSNYVPLFSRPNTVKPQKPISIFASSTFLDGARIEEVLLSEIVADIYNQALEKARLFNEIKTEEVFTEIKESEIYPYRTEITSTVIKEQKAVFDLVLHELVAKKKITKRKSKQDKQVIIELIKTGIEKSNSEELQRLLKEVLKLPELLVKDIVDLLKNHSLENLFKGILEVNHRLDVISGLKHIIFNPEVNKTIKERKHLQKILEQNTWIFGDGYSLGVFDSSLKTVLKQHLNLLGREDFIETIDLNQDGLNLIPDFCFFNQYANSLRVQEKENVIIEIKKPTKKIGTDELQQIKKYAITVQETDAFDKQHTKWTFILMGNKIDRMVEAERQQKDRKYGLVIDNPNYQVFVFDWSSILNEADARLNFLKSKMNYQSPEDYEAIKRMKEKYPHFMPELN